MRHAQIAVAIPVRNEAERIGKCLMALARQTICADHLVLLLNNCTDSTAVVVNASPPAAHSLHVIECRLERTRASAGVARALAMDHAASVIKDGVLLTTDADGEVPENWIETNLNAIERGADAICGRVRIDPSEALLIPRHLHEDDAREVAYGKLLNEIGSIIFPDPADPWPRHSEDSGASIAITTAMFRRVGGMPDVPSGEDRALIGKLRMIDAKVRHDPNIFVVVSGRIEGRAQGGMADTIRRRIVQQDEFVDERIEPALFARHRMQMKLRYNMLRSEANDATLHQLAKSLAVDPVMLADALDMPYLGAGWAALEHASPVLIRRRVAFKDLEREMAAAQCIYRSLGQKPPLVAPIVFAPAVPRALIWNTE